MPRRRSRIGLASLLAAVLALAAGPLSASAITIPWIPTTAITFRVSTLHTHGSGYTYNYPSIGGRWVVTQYDFASGSYLRAHDLRSGTDPWVTLPSDLGAQTRAEVSGDRVVFAADRAGASNKNIYMRDLVTGAETPISTNAADEWGPAIDGDSVTFMLDDGFVHASDPMLWDRRSHASDDVTTTGLTERYPVVFDDKVAFASPRISPEKVRYEEAAPRRSQYLASATGGLQWYPSIWSSRVVRDDVTNGDVYIATRTPDATRAAGASRYDTAIEISRRHFSAADTMIVASGESFPDALAASALAGTYDCPVLLTPRAYRPDSVKNEIARLDPDRVIVVGGAAAVSNEAFADLADGFGGMLERMYGASRYDTAKMIARRVVPLVGTTGNAWSHGVFVCNGESFADALAISPVAYQTRSPIVLVRSGALPSEAASALAEIDPLWVCVIGGPPAVSDAMANAARIAAGVGSYVRWSGTDRYATASRVASEAVADEVLDLNMIGLASGTSFPDALGGGVACGAYGSPILLTSPTSLSAATSTFLLGKQWEIGGLETFGGTPAISTGTHNAAVGTLK